MKAGGVETVLALDPRLDPDALARDFARDGRVQIADFLARDAAEALAADLARRTDWLQVLDAGEKVFELSRDVRAA